MTPSPCTPSAYARAILVTASGSSPKARVETIGLSGRLMSTTGEPMKRKPIAPTSRAVTLPAARASSASAVAPTAIGDGSGVPPAKMLPVSKSEQSSRWYGGFPLQVRDRLGRLPDGPARHAVQSAERPRAGQPADVRLVVQKGHHELTELLLQGHARECLLRPPLHHHAPLRMRTACRRPFLLVARPVLRFNRLVGAAC